ncbi:MAG TPA: hypothetical protein DC034_08025 [Clostridium sp.]|jgi:hypothetical protein|nr:hypothetical protein [Clostridium sp.]
MTINKYFRNGDTGDKFVAFSSWGKCFSISADLLKDASRKYHKLRMFTGLKEHLNLDIILDLKILICRRL